MVAWLALLLPAAFALALAARPAPPIAERLVDPPAAAPAAAAGGDAR